MLTRLRGESMAPVAGRPQAADNGPLSGPYLAHSPREELAERPVGPNHTQTAQVTTPVPHRQGGWGADRLSIGIGVPGPSLVSASHSSGIGSGWRGTGR